MSTIYKGSQLVEGPAVYTWKVGVGGSTRRTFNGTQTQINTKQLELAALGYETEITSGPKWTMVATINIDLSRNPNEPESEPVPIWELTPHKIEQTIYETQRPFVLGIPSTVKAAIEAKLKNPQNDKLFIVPIADLNNTAMIEKAMRVYMYKQMGADSKAINTLSLKRSIICSTQYNINWSIDKAMYLMTTNNIKSWYNVPNAIASLLPPSYYADETISTGDGAVPSLVVPFFYGWLEQHPSYQMNAINRVQISQEWIFGKYLYGPNGLYTVAT